MAIPSADAVRFLIRNGVTPPLDASTFTEADLAPSGPRGGPGGKAPAPPPVKAPDPPTGRRRDLGGFSLEVPKGWSVLDSGEGSILLSSDDGASALAVILNATDGRAMEDLARDYSRDAGGTAPAPADDEGMYSFAFDNNGKPAAAFVVPWTDGRHFLIYISGDVSHAGVEDMLRDLFG
jgi:hypothetical protein